MEPHQTIDLGEFVPMETFPVHGPIDLLLLRLCELYEEFKNGITLL
jgi:hypothetical protein